jgi:T5orf172 domain
MIYFIRAGQSGPVKIGYTECAVEKRVACLQIGNPEPLRLLHVCSGGLDREQWIHRLFDHARVHGEWFAPCDELMNYIECLREHDRIEDDPALIQTVDDIPTLADVRQSLQRRKERRRVEQQEVRS